MDCNNKTTTTTEQRQAPNTMEDVLDCNNKTTTSTERQAPNTMEDVLDCSNKNNNTHQTTTDAAPNTMEDVMDPRVAVVSCCLVQDVPRVEADLVIQVLLEGLRTPNGELEIVHLPTAHTRTRTRTHMYKA